MLTALAFALLLLAPLATAEGDGTNGNSGTIKVHDEADADPDTRNEPHVDCDDFWVEGFNMAVDSGTLTFYSWPPTGDKSVVLESTWTADDGEPRYHFLEGPFTLPAGHYRVEASNADGHVKSKMFWVECEEQGQPGCSEDDDRPECQPTCEDNPDMEGCEPTCDEQPDQPTCPPTCGQPDTPECQPTCEDNPDMDGCETVVSCPTGLTATANQDGSITLDWQAAAGSDATTIYRATGDGDFAFVDRVDASVETYKDTSTKVGKSYSYTVAAEFGQEESEDCPVAEATAIPEFPTVMAVGLASGGSLLAFALANRRKA